MPKSRMQSLLVDFEWVSPGAKLLLPQKKTVRAHPGELVGQSWACEAYVSVVLQRQQSDSRRHGRE